MRTWTLILGIVLVNSFALAQESKPERKITLQTAEEQTTDVTPETPKQSQRRRITLQAAESSEIKEVPQVTNEKPMNFWMAHKLDFSKSILESLTMADFEQLAEDAKQMQMLGKIEGFVRRKNPDYRTQLKNFDTALQELIRHAEGEDTTGAAVAFNQMTTSCVACHELLRKGID